MSTLTLVNLRKQFGALANPVVAVNDLNIQVEDGEFLCILGPSGCGKSTALRMVAGFEEPTSGDVQIDGQSIINMPANKRPTAMVFQKYTLWPHMKVYDNIAFGLRLRHLPKQQIDRDVRDALALVHLDEYGDRYPAQLSGGEQQRVAIARALVLRPKILLLDEPFSNLDALLRVRLREELRMIQRSLKITAVFVTHDQEEALSLADRIAVMRKGELQQLDKPATIYATPRTLFVADFIGAMNMLDGTAEGANIRVGDKLLPAPAGIAEPATKIAIRPEDVTVVAGGDGAWSGVVTSMSDLGHYRKVFVKTESLGVLKLFLPKAVEAVEGETLAFKPTRYLVFHGQDKPAEMHV